MSIRRVTLREEEAFDRDGGGSGGRLRVHAVTARLLHRLVMEIARALTKYVHVRRFTCDAFDYGRYATLAISRKVLRLMPTLGYTSARYR